MHSTNTPQGPFYSSRQGGVAPTWQGARGGRSGGHSPGTTRSTAAGSERMMEIKSKTDTMFEVVLRKAIESFREFKVSGKKFNEEQLQMHILGILAEYVTETTEGVEIHDGVEELQKTGEIRDDECTYEMSPELYEEFRKAVSDVCYSGFVAERWSELRGGESASGSKAGGGKKSKSELMRIHIHMLEDVYRKAIQDFKGFKASGKKFKEEQLQMHILGLALKFIMTPEGAEYKDGVEELMKAGVIHKDELKFVMNPEMYEELRKVVSDVCYSGFVAERWTDVKSSGSGSRSPGATRSKPGGSKSTWELEQKMQELFDGVFLEVIRDFKSLKKTGKKFTEAQLALHVLGLTKEAMGHADVRQLGEDLGKAGEWNGRYKPYKMSPEMEEELRKAFKDICGGNVESLMKWGQSHSPKPTRGTAANSKLMTELEQKAQQFYHSLFVKVVRDFKSLKESGKKLTQEQLALRILGLAMEAMDENAELIELGENLEKGGESVSFESLNKISPEMEEELRKVISDLCESGGGGNVESLMKWRS